MKHLQKIIVNELCCSCGGCAAVCPKDILHMQVQTNGDIAPAILNADECINCGLCEKNCPMIEGELNPSVIANDIWGNSSLNYSSTLGYYNDCFIGHRNNKDLWFQSSSGGFLTWILEKLFEKNLIDCVAVAQYNSAGDQNGIFQFARVSGIDELRNCSQSIYYPVSGEKIIKEILHSKERWAVIGVPCFCLSIRKNLQLRRNVHFVLGIACGMYQNDFYTRLLMDKSAGTTSTEMVEQIYYRKKNLNSSPNNYGFSVKLFKQPLGKCISYLDLPFFLGKNAFFRQNACNYCKDVFAETADGCFFDAWLPQFLRLGIQAHSICILRNHELVSIFKEFQNTEIEVESIDSTKVIQSQIGHVRRKKILIGCRQGEEAWPTLREHFEWVFQKYCQGKSKQIWQKYPNWHDFQKHIQLLLVVCRIINFYFDILCKIRHLYENSKKSLKISINKY